MATKMTADDALYGGPTVRNPCPRCKGYFGKGKRCANCGRGRYRTLLSRNRARRRNIGGKRGRNSGIVKNSKTK